jgi:hypothetical protein
VRDLPDIPLRVGECTRCATPEGLLGRALDRAAGALRLRQNFGHLLRRADVVGELDPWCAVTAELGPQAEHHAASLEEADVVIWLLGARPAERLVERAGAGEVSYPKRDKTDPLLQAIAILCRAV